MGRDEDVLTLEEAASNQRMTVEEYKQRVRMENAERIGINIGVFAKRLELIQVMTNNNNGQPLKGFTDYSGVGEEALYPDQLNF